jgi:hypothetical protein
MELGKEAKGYRKQFLDQVIPVEDVRVLEDIGFAWEKSEYQWAHVVVPALMAYKQAHGDLNIAQNFVVPSEGPWPEKCWGVRLGTSIHRIRTSSCFIGDHPGRRQWLKDEGFLFDARSERWEEAQRGFEQYHEMYGHMDITFNYIVPSEEPWPECIWGMKLGRVADTIRFRGYFLRDNPDRKRWLEERGFRFDTNEQQNLGHDVKWESSVIPALATYKDVHGELHVPISFAVPSEEPWPEESWGLRLGSITASIRSHGNYIRNHPERRQQLEDMGFVFDDAKRRWEETKSALQLYHEKYGHMNVPCTFVVPREDPWPEEIWDKRLGESVRSIRSYNAYGARDVPERRQWLEGHSFRWKLRQSTAERARASAAYYSLKQTGTAPIRM